jgi:glyoxylase-like metal-dependent hydrolase (beta-lactamase superfamily II)
MTRFPTNRLSILGHMHVDHAGGLDQFRDRKDVEIWVHDKELRSAFWSVATGADVGVYLPHYLDVRARLPSHRSR